VAGRAPFSRQRDRGGEHDQWSIARAADFAAEAYGWGPDYLDASLTDEQLVAYLDAAQERLTEAARHRFTDAVEAVRVGTILAHDAKQFGRWQADVARQAGHPGAGKDLAKLARDFGGGHVEQGGFEFRN
jgi:hypothetical protein